jgi:chromate transporter
MAFFLNYGLITNRYLYLCRTFLVVGSTSFGGYMALIAMIREQLVKRDQVIDDEMITEAIALASLLPGPVAVNVVAFVGNLLGGGLGALVAVISVLLPSFLLVLLLSSLYFQFQSVFDFTSVMAGVIPVVIGIIFSVSVAMAKKNCSGMVQIIIAILSTGALFLFSGYVAVLLTLLAAGIVGAFTFQDKTETEHKVRLKLPIKAGTIGVACILAWFTAQYFFPDNVNSKLFTEFSAVSLTLFGGGYVMVPVLKSMMVDQLNWLSYREFMFGISVGQITPGPILISATFFGYKMGGLPGAIIATLAIFLPSSLLMILASGFYKQLKGIWLVRAVLYGIRPAVVGLIFYSGVSLFISHLKDNTLWLAVFMVAVSLVSVSRFKINPAIVIIFGGILSYIIHFY